MRKAPYIFFGTVFVLLAYMMPSCTYHNEETFYPKVDCDTLNVSFKTTVAPLIKANCTDAGCHVNGNPSGGLLLESHADISGVGLERKDVPTGTFGRLYGSIAHVPGFSLMPQNGAQLLDCDIKKINAWVNAGAKDN